jgi:photosystem II stability/assembly factor-like uncharacterized protein
MKGDLSRNTFDRALHHSAVRLQQGRVVTDADWNEQADIARYRAERLARDTIGPCGAPLDGAGYALVAETNANAVLAVSASVVWVAGEDGALLRSANGGTSWALIDLQTPAHLRALAQAGGVGWAVGDGGVLRKTTNAGQTWQVSASGTTSSLRGAAAIDASHAWVVGDGGIALATADGGLHWSLAQTDAARLHAVRFVDSLNGLAVGQSGAVVGSRDGGQTWTAAASGSTAHLYALALSGTSRAWAAGSDGTILRSLDLGVTWLHCATPVTNTLLAIAFRNANEGWAVGQDGTVLHSTDGGANWSLLTSGVAATLRGLALSGNQPLWTVGDASTALRLDAGSPATQPVTLPAVNLSISPGRCWVDGVMCELEQRSSYANQPDGGASARLTPGSHLVYLQVWQRHVSALEAPALREVALGGPDTATRSRSLAQVRALPLPLTSPMNWNCDSSVPAWDALISAPGPRLAARAEPQLAAASLCEIAATAGYRRLENQLYRVEVHAGDANPSFKWSRENGSVAYAVVGITVDIVAQQTVVRLAARGRDANLDLSAHDRVELIDDEADAVQRAGVLLEYLNDGDDELELVLAGVPTGNLGQDPMRHPILRRWDQRPAAAGVHTLAIVPDIWIDLEDGVQVRFDAGGSYRPGDHWQIPARTINADVEWPRDDDGEALALPPAGIVDAYCRLGIVEVDAQGNVVVAADCREIFPPLTMLEQLLYVGGDGQDAAPGSVLPQPLTLRVARGSVPVIGVTVQFVVETGGGQIDTPLALTTGPDGIAVCHWTLGLGALAPARFQRVRAWLLNADGQPVAGQTLVFNATGSLMLQYVAGDGQQAPPGTTLPQRLELRVAHGFDPFAGAPVRVTVDQGGGSAGPPVVGSGPDGLVGIAWQLGNSGPQRLRAELIDLDGQVLQRLSFNASVVVAASGGGCEVTIGKGGQFEKLDSALLQELLGSNGGRVCICFLPGDHTLDKLVVGQDRGRISLHGCGHASIVSLAGSVQLSGFASVDLRDLVLRAKGEQGLVFTKTAELQLDAVEFERPVATAKAPMLRISGAQRVSIQGCNFTGAMPAVAVSIQDIAGDCQFNHNRVIGIVNFYGEPPGVLTDDQFSKLRSITAPLKLESVPAQLNFCDNTLSMLTVGSNVLAGLEQLAANGLFASVVLQGNHFLEQRNIFVANLVAFNANSFLATAAGGSTPYGLMVVNRATATANMARVFSELGVLQFILGSGPGQGPAGVFSKAANQVLVLP